MSSFLLLHNILSPIQCDPVGPHDGWTDSIPHSHLLTSPGVGSMTQARPTGKHSGIAIRVLGKMPSHAPGGKFQRLSGNEAKQRGMEKTEFQ